MSAIFESVTSGGFTVGGYLLCIFTAFICGTAAALSVSYRSEATRSFIVSLILLPAIVTTVIMMVNGNVGTGVAVMGAFSLVRFRSAAGKAREIAVIFLVMTAGLACAAGYIAIALLFTLTVCAVILLLARLPLGCDKALELHITVPESLCFTDAFDDLFRAYTKSCRLIKTRTSNMGSLYKLLYKIELKNEGQLKEFIDELRCRNGNLEIMVTNYERSDDL